MKYYKKLKCINCEIYLILMQSFIQSFIKQSTQFIMCYLRNYLMLVILVFLYILLVFINI